MTYGQLTRAQQKCLEELGDGRWHPGVRSTFAGAVLGVPAVALVRLGLAERQGASRGPRPSNPGYSYRVTAAGAAVLEGEALRLAEVSATRRTCTSTDDAGGPQG